MLTAVGDRWGMGTAYRMKGLIALTIGDYAEAQQHLRRSLETFQGIIGGWDVSQSLLYLGEAMAAAGHAEGAESLFVESLRLAYEVHAAPTPLALDALMGLAQLKVRSRQVQEAMRLSILVLEHSAAVHETRQRAVQLCLEAEADLTVLELIGVQEWVATHSLDAVIANFLDTAV